MAYEAAFLFSGAADQGSGLPETRADFRGVAIYGVGLSGSGSRGRFTGRLGLFTGDLDIDSAVRTGNISTSGFALGFGYVFDLNDRFSVRGDFDTFFSPDVDTLSSATIGVQLRFGD